MDSTNKAGFMESTLNAVDSGKFAFYLSFVGIIIQFVHNILAIAGTLELFNTANTPLLLYIGEWILAVGIGGFFAFTLWLFTIRTSRIRVKLEGEGDPNNVLIGKYMKLIATYTGFDFLIDFYFWVYIVFMGADLTKVQQLWAIIAKNWILLLVILPIAVMLPLTLQYYSREVTNKEV